MSVGDRKRRGLGGGGRIVKLGCLFSGTLVVLPIFVAFALFAVFTTAAITALKTNCAATGQPLGNGGPVPPVGGIASPTDFANILLTDLGVTPSAQNVIAIRAWTQAEDPWSVVVQTHNPMNTTLDEPGAVTTNSAGVKSYPSWQEGVQATVTTLNNGLYGGVLAALQSGTSALAVATAVGASPWGTSGTLMTQIINSWGGGPSGTPSGTGPPTVTTVGTGGCCNQGPVGGGGTGPGGTLSPQKTAYVRQIIGIAKTMNMGSQGELIALMVALDESGLQEYANSNVPISLSYPHDAVGSDHGSVGIFQQQVNSDGSNFGWGTIQQLMNPTDGTAYQAYRFLNALQGISGWQNMQPWVAAQAVQRSGTPDGSNYEAQMGAAQSILNANVDAPAVPLPAGATTGPSPGPGTGPCSGGGGIDGCVNPIKPGLYGPARTDMGVDWLPNTVNTPVYAICPGTMTAIFPPGSSGWPGFGTNGGGTFLQYMVTSGGQAGHCIYVAENINNITVKVGDTFTAGQQIATSQPGPAWTEWGWARCAGTGQYGGPLTPYNGAPDGTQTLGGKAFCRFLQAMGAKCADDPGPGPNYP